MSAPRIKIRNRVKPPIGAPPKPIEPPEPHEDLSPEEKNPKIFRVTSFSSVSHRFISYVRELEQLAGEVENYIGILENDKPGSAAWVVARFRNRLEKVYTAGVDPCFKEPQPPPPKESKDG